MPPKMSFISIIKKPLVWADGKGWWWRLPIIGWFLIMLIQNIQDPSFAMNRLSNPFSAIDLGIHELGHIIFMPFGTFMRIAGGSIFQCLFPLMWFAGFLQKKWYFAACMCWCWLGLNLFDVATYVADARVRLIPLSVGPAAFGVDVLNVDAAYDSAHDWYQLLSRTNHLSSDLVIAHNLRIAGIVMFIIGLGFGAILLIRMFISSFRKP